MLIVDHNALKCQVHGVPPRIPLTVLDDRCGQGLMNRRFRFNFIHIMARIHFNDDGHFTLTSTEQVCQHFCFLIKVSS